MIYLRRPDEIARIRASSRIVAEALDLAATLVVPGATTREIDQRIETMIRDSGGEPSFLGYHKYPAATCISINEQVVHGIPGDRRIVEGDLVSVDVGVCKNGYHGDSARTFPVGKVGEEAQRLLRVTEEALMAGIAAVRAGVQLGAISHAVQTHAESQGYSVVR